MKKMCFLILIFLLFAASVNSAKILYDYTKDQTAGNADWIIDDNRPVPSPTNPTRENDWIGANSQWAFEMYLAGHTVHTLTTSYGITYGDAGNTYDLSKYDVFIVTEPQNRFTTTERDAVLDFVYNGGSLFIVGNHNGSDRNSSGWDSPAIWNDFGTNTYFGIYFQASGDSYNNISRISTNLATGGNDVIINGPYGTVTDFGHYAGTTMVLNTGNNSNVKGHVWYDSVNGTYVMFATSRYGSGKICAIGDSSPTDDGTGTSGNTLYDNWNEGTNSTAILNGMAWFLSKPASSGLFEDFETGSKGTYDSASVTLSSGNWYFSDSLIGTLANDRKNDSKSARIRNGYIEMAFDKNNGAGVFSCYHAKFGTDGNSTWKLQMSTNSGTDWTDVGSEITTDTTTLTLQEFVIEQEGSVRFRIQKTDGTTTRINIDDINITNHVVGSDPVWEDFETGTKGAYAGATVSLSSGNWWLEDSLLGTTTSDRKNGAQSVRMRNGNIAMEFDKEFGAGKFSVWHAKYGTDADGTWKLQKSTNGGVDWTDVGSLVTTSSTTLTESVFDVNQEGQVRFKIQKTDGTTRRVNFDDVSITDFGVISCDESDTTAPYFTSDDSGIIVTDPQTGGKLNVFWDEANDPENADTIRYVLYRSTDAMFTPSVNTMVDTGLASKNYIDSGLVNGTTYYYIVQAFNCVNLQSDNTDRAYGVPTHPAQAPELENVLPSNKKNSVHWRSVTGADEYSIYYSGTQGGPYQLAGTSLTTSFIHEGLENGSTYYYVVKNYDAQRYPSLSPNSNELFGRCFYNYNDVDITGWTLRQYESLQNFVFPEGAVVPARGYLIVGRQSTRSAFETFWGITLPDNAVYINSNAKMPLINGDEYFELYDDGSILIDGPTWYKMIAGNTAQRNNPGDNASNTNSWTVQGQTFADPGSGVGTLSNSGVVINEYSDASNYLYEFVEIFNDGTSFGLDEVYSLTLDLIKFKFSEKTVSINASNTTSYKIYETAQPTNEIIINSVQMYDDDLTGILETGTMNPNTQYTLELIGNIKSIDDLSISNDLKSRDFTTGVSVSSSVNPLLWSDWSKNGLVIAYLEYDKATSTSQIKKRNRDGTGLTQITQSSDNVSHLGQISFSPDDDFVIYTANDSDSTIIKKTDILSGVTTILKPSSLIGWGGWLDPHWTNNINQITGTEMVICSISGNLWVFDPATVSDTFSSLIRITALAGEYTQTYVEKDMLLNARWSPDNTKITFIRRYAGAGVVVSRTYVLNEIQDIIDKKIVIDSWDDTRLIVITDENLPVWSPSFSRDGTMISYVVDIDNSFDNVGFWTDPDNQIINSNFDIYLKSSDGSGNTVEFEINPCNDGFVKWATTGGDQFIYTRKPYSGNYSLNIINHPSTAGFTKSGMIKDHSYSFYVPYDSNPFHGKITMESPLSVPAMDKNTYRYINECRLIKTEAGVDISLQGDIGIHFMNASIRGYRKSDVVMLEYDRSSGIWSEVPSVMNGDILGGIVTARVNRTGYFALAVKKTAKSTDDKVRLYPNPVRVKDGDPEEVNIEYTEPLEYIRIYTIAGELVREEVFTGSETSYVWDLENMNDKKVASGIYIYVLKLRDEKKFKTGKIAIIR